LIKGVALHTDSIFLADGASDLFQFTSPNGTSFALAHFGDALINTGFELGSELKARLHLPKKVSSYLESASVN